MCGIFAYMNYNVPKERHYILEVLFTGFRRLEYRGYDSAGIAIDSDVDAAIGAGQLKGPAPYEGQLPLVFCQEGKIDSLVKSVYSAVDPMKLDLKQQFVVHAGIAHSRWATHGVPSSRNSHPHSSGAWDEFLVVHNGIITNYEDIKNTLAQLGFTFESDTDTEVIPKLAKFVFDQFQDIEGTVTFSQVVAAVMKHLKGAYALIFKSPHFPNELIASKQGSTLVLGIKELLDGTDEMLHGDMEELIAKGMPKELFFSSDTCAIVEHTRSYLSIEDDEMVHVKDGCISVFKLHHSGGQPILLKRALSFLEIEVEQIKKGNYDHYMQKEIHEQPRSLLATMRGRVEDNSVILAGLEDHVRMIRHGRRIVFVGCGTSYHAVMAARPIIEELCDIPIMVEVASDLLDRQCPIYREDTVIFVSQSGETADMLLALEYALTNEALCLAITNKADSALARKAHWGVDINAGCEIGVASTKAYTSQLTVIVMMALAIGFEKISTSLRRKAIIDGLLSLPGKASEVLKLDAHMRDLAKSLVDTQSIIVLGRGYNYATALEGALKLKEVSLVHCEGLLAGEIKHGPLALVDEALPIIVIATNDDCFRKQQSVIQQLLARNGRLIVICSEGDASIVCPSNSCTVVEVPRVVDCLQPIINIIPLQLLAYHLTVLRGSDVDQPRNLAKSVTTQ